MKNWKTTVAGVIIIGTGVAASQHWITPDVAKAIITIAGGCGFVLAKDNNVSDAK